MCFWNVFCGFLSSVALPELRGGLGTMIPLGGDWISEKRGVWRLNSRPGAPSREWQDSC